MHTFVQKQLKCQFLHQIWRNMSVFQQWMLCSEWVPSEWESDKNITIIHTTPVHQLMSGEAKSWNKSIKTFSTPMWVHNNTSSSEQVHLLLSHIKVQPCISLELFWLVNGAWSVQISLLIQTIHFFHWRMQYYELWTLKTSWFLTNTYLSSQDVNWWTGVVWIIVMLLSDSHSDGTHSLTAEHPLMSDVMLHFSKSDAETNSPMFWMSWGLAWNRF